MNVLEQILYNWAQAGGIPLVMGPVVGRKAVVDAAYTLSVSDSLVAMTSLTAARTWTLPAVSAEAVGKFITFADESGNAGHFPITIAAAGSDTIDSVASVKIQEAYGVLHLYCTGAGWKLLPSIGVPTLATVADAAYTIKASDTMVVYTSLSAARTATLPAVNTVRPGKIITVIDGSGLAGTDNITVAVNGSDTINGASSKVINSNYGVARFLACGTLWLLT